MNKSYILTPNIDLSDGLASGATEDLLHIEYNDAGEIGRIWLEFPGSTKTGVKRRKKAAVPIDRRKSTISLVPNKTVVVKRNHVPIESACIITIHKSLGGTFSEIVYAYQKTQLQQLVYEALSRVTSHEGLHVVTDNDDRRFYHGRWAATSLSSLQAEFRRFSSNRLQIIGGLLTKFIKNSSGMSIFSFHCQSLRAHVADLSSNEIANTSNFLLLSETWLNNDDHIDIPNFDLVVKFKRNIRTVRVAIYDKMHGRTRIVTPQMDIITRPTESLSVQVSNLGELCACRCILENGQTFYIYKQRHLFHISVTISRW